MQAPGKKTTVWDCEIIEFPRIENEKGNISPIHSGVDLPFEISRIFYTYDIPAGVTRGGHSHKECHEVLIAACGSFEVELDDGTEKRTVRLNRPYFGLHLVPGVWAEQKDYSSGSVCLVMTSHNYDDSDYIRDYGGYLKYKGL